MSEPKKSSDSKKKKLSVRDLEKRVYQLETELDAMQNEAGTYRRKSWELEAENQNLKTQSAYYKDDLARTKARFSGYRMMELEVRTNSVMRSIVVLCFAIIGPVLLLIYLWVLSEQEVLLDIFKIWLGAAIGISTNLLQRNPSEKPAYEIRTKEAQQPAPTQEPPPQK